MNETIYIVVLSSCNADSLAHIKCRSKALLPESLIDGLTLEGQHTDSNTAYLPMTDGKEAAIGGKYLHNIAFLQFGVTLCMMDGTAEYPRMEAPKAFLLALAKNYFIYHLIIYHLQFYSFSPSGESDGGRTSRL